MRHPKSYASAHRISQRISFVDSNAFESAQEILRTQEAIRVISEFGICPGGASYLSISERDFDPDFPPFRVGRQAANGSKGSISSFWTLVF